MQYSMYPLELFSAKMITNSSFFKDPILAAPALGELKVSVFITILASAVEVSTYIFVLRTQPRLVPLGDPNSIYEYPPMFRSSTVTFSPALTLPAEIEELPGVNRTDCASVIIPRSPVLKLLGHTFVPPGM